MRNDMPVRLIHLLAATVSLATMATAANARQDAGGSPDDQAEAASVADTASDQSIIVTGSRITRDGYQAPTPVTVATTDDLLKASPSNIPDGLNKLPQFVGSSGPNRSANTFATPNHGNILNLRGLGGIRTLILFDGVRVSPTTYLGNVDVDVLPQLLTQRVDVVTAGASASYGSDAVAGVVNFVLDKNFTGLKAIAQGGFSSRGDNGTNRFAVAGGFDIGDRLHILLSVDHNQSGGYLVGDRPALAQQGIAVGSIEGGGQIGTAANPLIFRTGARYNLASFGGLAVTGPFANTVFTIPGNYRAAITGTPTATPGFFIGGDYYYGPDSQSASAATKNDTLFGRISYELTDDITAYVQFLGARNIVRYNSLPNLLLFAPQIYSGNAFLPTELQDQLTASNTASFSLRKLFDEFGPIPATERTHNYQTIAGLQGKVAGLDWQISYSHGESIFRFSQPNQFENTKLAAALDAVRDPVTGNIVCRPQLSSDPAVRARYADCVPLNPFGYGAASDAARDYVMGESLYRAKTVTNDVTVGLSGDLIPLPAGMISFALGAEYRDASLDLISNADPATPVDITGLRGLAATATRFYLTNTGTANGSNNVKEVFGEVAVPLLRDRAFAEQLDVSGAIRYTDYSTSGGVTTWKLGASWVPTNGLRFRVTRSRDIRAPTLFDLFAGAQTTVSSVIDPHTNVSGSFIQTQSGNPSLRPEVGNTLSVGFVLQPDFLRGFALSVDGYKVQIDGAITTLSTLQILQDCEASGGTAASCDLITRPLPFSDHSAANYPTAVQVSGVNIATIDMRGIDFDASYRTGLGAGALSLRLYATYVDRFRQQLSASQSAIEYAGYTTNGTRVDTPIPRIKGNLNVNYDIGVFSIFAQENLIGAMKLGPTQVYTEKSLPAFLTTDLTLTVRPKTNRIRSEIFFTVNNLFDATPPEFFQTTVPGLGLGTLQILYDTTGRQFTAGVRVSF